MKNLMKQFNWQQRLAAIEEMKRRGLTFEKFIQSFHPSVLNLYFETWIDKGYEHYSVFRMNKTFASFMHKQLSKIA